MDDLARMFGVRQPKANGFRGPTTFFIQEVYKEKLVSKGGLYNKTQYGAQI